MVPDGVGQGPVLPAADMTNVYFNPAFGMYDYVSLGVKQ